MHSLTFTLLILLIVTLINGLPFIADNKNSDQYKSIIRNALTCQEWYDQEPDPSKYLAQTLNPPCQIPPTFPSKLIDGWSVDSGCDAAKQPNTCDLHKGAYGCYRHALDSSGPGAQACYDKNGQWISDPWKGAGTLDVENPMGGFIQAALHGIYDVLPYYNCCPTDVPNKETCNLYYEKRPSGQCEDKPAI